MFSQKFIRFSDIFISLLLLIFFLPIIFITLIFLLFKFKLNILFVTQRVGMNGIIFGMLKFRSYEINHIELQDKYTEPVFIGKIIRRLSIDEIPQLFNVLSGKMSIVGPRPLPPSIEDKIKKKYSILIRSVPPGITGLSQIRYSGKKRSLRHKIKYDVIYVKNISIKLYAFILLQTLPVIFKRFISNKKGVSN